MSHMPSFRVLNTPTFEQPRNSSNATERSAPSGGGARQHHVGYADLPTDPRGRRCRDTPQSEYQLNYDMAALPDIPPLQEPYRPYRPAPPLQPDSHARPQPSPLQESRQQGHIFHTAATSMDVPYHRISYPPIPHVPHGMTMEEVLAPQGKRRFQSLRATGRDMAVIRRARDTGDPRLTPALRPVGTGRVDLKATSLGERRERKRVQGLEKNGEARRRWLD